jgi:CheY-like chemotaxis protein
MEKKKILIVDDEEGFTHTIKLNLEASGRYEVREENRGALALATAKAYQPDLILLDIIMPDKDGSLVAIELKEDAATKNIPVVFLTVVVKKQETDGACSVIGGHPFIAKPVNVRDLTGCIEQYMRK